MSHDTRCTDNILKHCERLSEITSGKKHCYIIEKAYWTFALVLDVIYERSDVHFSTFTYR